MQAELATLQTNLLNEYQTQQKFKDEIRALRAEVRYLQLTSATPGSDTTSRAPAAVAHMDASKDVEELRNKLEQCQRALVSKEAERFDLEQKLLALVSSGRVEFVTEKLDSTGTGLRYCLVVLPD